MLHIIDDLILQLASGQVPPLLITLLPDPEAGPVLRGPLLHQKLVVPDHPHLQRQQPSLVVNALPTQPLVIQPRPGTLAIFRVQLRGHVRVHQLHLGQLVHVQSVMDTEQMTGLDDTGRQGRLEVRD